MAHVDLPGDVTLGKDDEVVTFVSRNLEPYRGFHIFLRSLPRLLLIRKNVVVVIVGTDSLSGYGAPHPSGQTWKEVLWTETAGALTDQQLKRVVFVGNLGYKDFVSLLQVSKVHVYLTYPFVLSWSLLEAMSIGCPVVASDTAPLEEVIEHEKNGILTDFFAPDNLATSIHQLLNDETIRLQLGAEARRTAVDKYDLSRQCLPNQISWVEK